MSNLPPPPPPPGQYPPPGGQPPGYPAPAQPLAVVRELPKLRGGTVRRLGWIFLAASLAILIVAGVIDSKTEKTAVKNFQRVQVSAGQGTVHFNKTGKYAAYYESDSFNADIGVPIVPVKLTAPSGADVTLKFYGNRSDGKLDKVTYDRDGHKGAALYQYTIAETGTYQVELTPNSQDGADADIAFGKSLESSQTAFGIVGLIGGLLFIASIVLLIVGFVKKRRHKKEIAKHGYVVALTPGQAPPPPG